jgi:hypothetical protein
MLLLLLVSSENVILISTPPTICKGSLCPTSSPEFVGGGFFDDSHSEWGEMEAQCHFDLHFLYG